jgi:flagellar biosynthesis protein FliP
MSKWVLFVFGVLITLGALSSSALAQSSPSKSAPPTLSIKVETEKKTSGAAAIQVSEPIKVIALLTVLSLAPAIIVSMTAFIRIIIVLSMLRHALSMPETPPNMVLVGLALLLTVFVMMPVVNVINRDAWQPLAEGEVTVTEAVDRASNPLRGFMLRQVRDADLQLMYELSREPIPNEPEQVSLLQLIPAFILNELRVAFQIGFVIFLPFLLIDLVVSSVLLSLGMLMVPPATIALP